jgi:hypothetical protein
MHRSQITQMTIGQLKHSTDNIDILYYELRNSMSPPATLTLPFDVTKKVRTRALEHRVSDIYGSFKEMKYKSTIGFYSDGNGTQIPFYFEIAIFHDVWKLQNNNLVFRQAINGSAIPNTGWSPFSGCKFEWTTKGSKNKYISNSIYHIFEHFGYAYSKDKCRKPHSLIIANLVCPKIDYQSYGKSRIIYLMYIQCIYMSKQLTYQKEQGKMNMRMNGSVIEKGSRKCNGFHERVMIFFVRFS